MHRRIPIETIEAWAENIENIRLLYLFGSQARGRTGPMSDYDFGVLLDDDTDAIEIRSRLAHEIGQLVDTSAVDVVLLNRAPVELSYAIIAGGIRLFERSRAARVDFEAYVLGRYGDYLPILRGQRRQIINATNNAKRVQRYRAALRRIEGTPGTSGGASDAHTN
jgi:predicted nucleotidyltransferase